MYKLKKRDIFIGMKLRFTPEMEKRFLSKENKYVGNWRDTITSYSYIEVVGISTDNLDMEIVVYDAAGKRLWPPTELTFSISEVMPLDSLFKSNLKIGKQQNGELK